MAKKDSGGYWDNAPTARKEPAKKKSGGFSKAVVTLLAITLLCTSTLCTLSIMGIPWENWLVTHISELISPSQPLVMEELTPSVRWTGWQHGVCVEDTVLLTSHNGGEEIHTVPSGERLTILEQRDDMLRVRSVASIGWIPRDAARAIGERTLTPKSSAVPKSVIDLSQTEYAAQLDEISDRFGCMGIQVAVISGGDVYGVYSTGYANKSTDLMMNCDTKVRVASLTKVLVAMCALSMEEQGIIDLDEDISTYLGYKVRNPDYRSEPITMRMLLCHTSSMSDFGVNGRDPTWMETHLPLETSFRDVRPGTAAAWGYNNTAVCLAGKVLEKAAGMTLVDYAEGYFFQPLGIDASLHAAKVKAQDNIAMLYRAGKVAFSVKSQINRPYYDTPGDNFCLYAGDLTISALDYARLMCILANGGQYNGTYYLSPETVEEMLTPLFEVGRREQCLTIKRYNEQFEGRDSYYHTGNAYGVLSSASFDRTTGDGVVVTTTMSGILSKTRDIYAPCYQLSAFCYDTLLED